MKNPLLKINRLEVGFKEKKYFRTILHDINFNLYTNEILGIVGESGSGKSLSSLAILGLLPKNAAISSGEIIFENKNLLALSDKQLRNIRGKKISMIFQEPMSSLHPSMKCVSQLQDILLTHQLLNKQSANADEIESSI